MTEPVKETPPQNPVVGIIGLVLGIALIYYCIKLFFI